MSLRIRSSMCFARSCSALPLFVRSDGRKSRWLATGFAVSQAVCACSGSAAVSSVISPWAQASSARMSMLVRVMASRVDGAQFCGNFM
eukprot:364267-Pleurochrysis_carterae.AAC.1